MMGDIIDAAKPIVACPFSACQVRQILSIMNVRIWTPPRFASTLLDGDEVRLRTYIRLLELAYVDAEP